MGALHAGHLALLGHARDGGLAVAVSIFVNPTQFGPGEDFARYPRQEEEDLAQLRGAGCDLVWLPGRGEMYADGDATMIEVAGPALGWEGDIRPGHFRGVATVVAKLFGQVRPVAAVFGEKDWQQLQVIRRMVADLALPVRIVGAPVVREADGLAMSSRNRFLSVAERTRAPDLYAALLEMRAALLRGTAPGQAAAVAAAALQAAGFGVDYLALVDGASLAPATELATGAAGRGRIIAAERRRIIAAERLDIIAAERRRIIAAARLGSVRLLDNIGLA